MHRSTILFAAPSLLEGWARIVDIGDTLSEYNVSPSPEWADAVALWMDWYSVGDDIRTAMKVHADAAPSDSKPIIV